VINIPPKIHFLGSTDYNVDVFGEWSRKRATDSTDEKALDSSEQKVESSQ